MPSEEFEREIEKKARRFFRYAIAKPSDRFPSWFIEVDHSRLGERVRLYRISRHVQALEVGEELGLSKVQVHFLETGRKAWDEEILRDYIRAVEELDLAGKPLPNHRKKHQGRPRKIRGD